MKPNRIVICAVVLATASCARIVPQDPIVAGCTPSAALTARQCVPSLLDHGPKLADRRS